MSAQSLATVRPGETPEVSAPSVDVRNLSVRLVSRDMNLTLIHDVSFTLRQGDVLCGVGVKPYPRRPQDPGRTRG